MRLENGGEMPCKVCKSDNLQTLDGELTITQPDLKGLKTAPVYVCRNILVCLDCGFAEIIIPANELRLLKRDKPAFSA